ncbi:thermonuclease family protein [Nitrospira sp. Nam74]
MAALDLEGRVVGVADGDTLTLLQDRQRFNIRLQHVDAPELHGQAYGQATKRFTSDLAFGKEVHVHTEQQDGYGRWLGVVTLPNGLVVNQALVQAGYAWWYRQYSTDRIRLRSEGPGPASRSLAGPAPRRALDLSPPPIPHTLTQGASS